MRRKERLDYLKRIMEKDLMIFDGDGTLYIDTTTTPSAGAFLDYLVKEGKRFVIMTNNSSYSKGHHMERIGKVLGRKLKAKELYVSTEEAANYLRNNGVTRAFILGTPECVEDFHIYGVDSERKDPDVVVVAFDKTLTYAKVRKASNLISDGKPYIVTNPDLVCPTRGGHIPDAGSILAMIRSATNAEPLAVTGKPNTIFLDYVLGDLGVKRSECVIFGDRIYTDIAMANDAGVLSVLMLTGESRMENRNDRYRPDLIVPSFDELGRATGREAWQPHA
jgi:HAD superfamily hydrolase (TIGR01450 family)